MASTATPPRPLWGAATTALGRVDVGRARLDPSLAIQRKRGLDVRPARAPAPAPFQPLPERVDLPTLMACLEPVVYGRGTSYLDLRPTIHAYALLVLLRRQAQAPRKGRRLKDATVRRSIRLLVRMMAPACGWDLQEETWAARDRHESSIRRWLALLVDAGLLACERVVDELDQDRATDFTLLPCPVPPDEAVETTKNRLARWRKRYGDQLERSRVAGPVLAYLAATRKAIDEEHRHGGRRRRSRGGAKRVRRGPKNTFGALRSADLSPLGKGTSSSPSGKNEVFSDQLKTASVDASARGRETDWGETRVDGVPDSMLAAALEARFGTDALREGGEAERWEFVVQWQTARLAADTARWEARIAKSEETCHQHVSSPADPLPALPALKLAVAGRAYGALGMVEDPTIPGMSERQRRRLRAAAARWIRWASPEVCDPGADAPRALPAAAGSAAAPVPSPTAELLRLASELGPNVGNLWATLTARFVARSKAARLLALGRGAAGVRRDEARRRDAERHRLLVLGYWPEWIARDGDQFVTLGHTRAFVQVHHLPSRRVLESDTLRRWLRAVTALMWGVVPATIEFSDPDGRNIEIPVDTTKARHRGQITRGSTSWKANRQRRPR